jgi:membrane-associated protease RseP (regulator of RpoE activity)
MTISLAVYGNGTSPVWNEILDSCNARKGAGFELVLSESGVGPSDHTSFYLEDVPVLHFFTGQHEDYHKPTDTADKLNYQGMLRIADFAECIVGELELQEEIPFTKTKDSSSDDAPRFKVTLGVVPDYLFSGSGMRIDGVSEGRPAQLAGLQKGDVVVRIGELEVADMMGYMEGLSMFEEGEQTEVEVLRKGASIVVEVTWD